MKHHMLAVTLLFIAGCSAHNPLIIKNTTETSSVSTNKYPAHTNKVFLTPDKLSPDIKYEVLETINVGKVWYGSKGNIEISLANRARQIGADAIINFKSWRQPSGFSWAAPHGSGDAIKLQNKSSIKFKNYTGKWK
jgi:hypothetical protein